MSGTQKILGCGIYSGLLFSNTFSGFLPLHQRIKRQKLSPSGFSLPFLQLLSWLVLQKREEVKWYHVLEKYVRAEILGSQVSVIFVEPKNNILICRTYVCVNAAITQDVRSVHLTSALVVLATVTRTQLIVQYGNGEMKPIWNWVTITSLPEAENVSENEVLVNMNYIPSLSSAEALPLCGEERHPSVFFLALSCK